MFRNTYDYFKRQILRQEINGQYKRHNTALSCRILRAFGMLNILLGVISLITFASITSFHVGYSGNFSGPIYFKKGKYKMYIEIKQLYQNNLRYAKSISYDQISGKTDDLNLSDTYPYDYDGTIPYYPAGLVAHSFFQDKITIEGLDIDTEDISWGKSRRLIGITDYSPGEVAFPEGWSPTTNEGTVPLNTYEDSGLPILNEQFANWIHLSGFSRFRKLWGKIDVPESGDYFLEIDSIFDLSSKRIFFTEMSWLGYKNYYLVAGLFGIGLISLLAPTILEIMERRLPPPQHHGQHFNL